ncbi:hypothetical protein DRQ33_05545, partial [bacterium]
FGYLLAFPISALLVGSVNNLKFSETIKIIIAIVVGILVIYLIGILWLIGWSKYIVQKPITLTTAISVGALPFIPFDIMKAICAYFIVRVTPKSMLKFQNIQNN